MAKSGKLSVGERIESFTKWMVFSLLVAILVGVFTSVPGGPIPPIPNEMEDKRDAQNLASVYHSAIHAGSQELKDANGVLAAIGVLRRGAFGSDSFSDTKFIVPHLSDEDAREAMQHLRWKENSSEGGGELVYEPDCCGMESEKEPVFDGGDGKLPLSVEL